MSSHWSRAVLNLCVMCPNVIKLKNLCVIKIEENLVSREMSPCFPLQFFVHVCILTKELTNKMDLLALNGKTLTVTQGSSSPGPAPTTSSFLCPYVNLLLCHAQPSGEKHVISQQFWRHFHTTFLEIEHNLHDSFMFNRRFVLISRAKSLSSPDGFIRFS